jgi:hypothetical protein
LCALLQERQRDLERLAREWEAKRDAETLKRRLYMRALRIAPKPRKGTKASQELYHFLHPV